MKRAQRTPARNLVQTPARWGLSAAAACVVLAASSALAGDLTPPPGPIMPTMKTLTQVEPRIDVNSLPGDATAMHVITEPGSYMLTADIVGETGKHGVLIDADSVTLDLNGYTIRGMAGSLSGVKVDVAPGLLPHVEGHWIAIRDGTILGAGGWGIDATDVSHVDVRDLMVLECGGGVIMGDGAFAARVMVEACAGDGIRVKKFAMLTQCTSMDNTGYGVFALMDLRIESCSIGASGQDGVRAGRNAVITDCTVGEAAGNGIQLRPGSRVESCSILNSALNGVMWHDPNTHFDDAPPLILKDCVIDGSGAAGLVSAEANAQLLGSTIHGNATGIVGQAGADHWLIADTTVSGNTVAGMTTDGGGWTVTDCQVTKNGGNGILMDGPLHIVERTKFVGNGGAALAANGAGNILRDLSVTADGVMGAASLVSIGDRGAVASLAVDVSNSVFSGAVVDLTSVTRPHHDGLSIGAKGVTADSLLELGGASVHGGRGNDAITAQDCILTTAIVSINGDGNTFGGTVTALGSTTAPVALRMPTSNSILDFPTYINVVPGVPIGLDVMGSSNRVAGLTIRNVPVGGTGVKTSAGSGNVFENIDVAGAGAAIVDAADYTVWRDSIVAVTGAGGASAVTLGMKATMHGMVVNASAGMYSGPVVDASAGGASISGLTLKAAGVTADSVLSGNAILMDGPLEIHAGDCMIATAVLKIVGDAATLGGGSINTSGTTSATAGISVMGNQCNLDIPFYIRLTANVPVGIDLSGSSNRLGHATVASVPAGGTGIRVAGGNGNEVEACHVSGGSGGAYTGVSVSSNGNLVISNRVSALMGGTPIDNTGAGNLIGAIINAGNFGTGCDPCGNIVH